MNVLLVEDEANLASFIKKGLEAESFNTDVAYDGYVGRQLFQQNEYDVVILDVNLPSINGFELCQLIKRENERMPVLMLTALDSLADKVKGFDAGADDYLPKPFAFQELLLRIRAISKRHELRYTTELRLADLTLNLTTKVVTRAQKRIELTSKEFALLEYMLLHKGKIISRAELAERVWETDFDSNTNVIDVYINYLRKKIDKDFSPKLVHTVIGMGYSLHES
ncbi:MAG: response regulator transcription factor [Stigonema ocellatum SAG 48.90 = DSM 106950]|uniref:response regulator transcription factor n=1 Tax=Spirosoma sp. TaxID=1899569 RepID=UPI00263249B5|nr:response regulator transcription factor [Spirosoma sp.]MBR8837121.1 response regulator transcription factor [Stigonema ocellatum SAG 48.90 = DSM 106950]MCX6213862.1 response regulator transcription factor [Spirosoma sp.]